MTFINEINNILWTYILIIMLLGCAIWFSIQTRKSGKTRRAA